MRSIRVCDYTEYREDKCHNGGSYVYFTCFDEVGKDDWVVSYGTSAEFEYCPAMGNFGNCCDNCDECECFEHITEDNVLRRIAEYNGNINIEVQYTF